MASPLKTNKDPSATCKIPNVVLANGVEMPQMMLGTAYLITERGELASLEKFTGFIPERAYRSVQLALEAGIRGIDTALIYRSHEAIRQVLGEWFRTGQLERKDVFLTSKVYHGPSPVACEEGILGNMDELDPEQVTIAVRKQLETSLMELSVGYLDLCLLHWPAANYSQSPLNAARRSAAWKVLEEYYDRGWLRAIGVSNFSELHLEQLIKDGFKVKPMLNQLESSIYLQHDKIIQYCQANDILVQAYSPLGRGVVDITKDDVVLKIADKHGRNAGQVAMRYLVQKGMALTVLSTSATRLQTNQDIFAFALDEDDMEKLNGLNRPDGSWGLCSPYEMS